MMSSQKDVQTLAKNAGPTTVDVAIVGAGLAGTTLAMVLNSTGRKVALIDPHRVHHEEFRAEKTRLDQMRLLEKLGLGPVIRPLVTPTPEIHVYRFDSSSSAGRARSSHSPTGRWLTACARPCRRKWR